MMIQSQEYNKGETIDAVPSGSQLNCKASSLLFRHWCTLSVVHNG